MSYHSGIIVLIISNHSPDYTLTGAHQRGSWLWIVLHSVLLPLPIIRVITKIGRLRRGSTVCYSRVWLQARLVDTRSYYQLIINVTFSEDLRKHKMLMKNSENSPFLDFVWNFSFLVFFLSLLWWLYWSLRLVHLKCSFNCNWFI